MSEPLILGIESSCDDTAAAVIRGSLLLSNVMAGQDIHRRYGGVVPEYASRAHQQNIIPVVDQSLQEAKIHKNDLQAVAFTQGPGLMGSLLVGASFAKAFALALKIPLIGVDHMEAHILSHFICEADTKKDDPGFPFLCLTVSGGHTRITRVESHLRHQVIGSTIDDAAGEAFDKAAKIMGLAYPGGVLIDKHAATGNPEAFSFPQPSVQGNDFSFSGLKTSFLYFIRDRLREQPGFIEENLNDLCASIQHAIVESLIVKIRAAVRSTGIREVAIAGGVSANSGLRRRLQEEGLVHGWKVHIPKPAFTTDNAAMIAIAGLFRYRAKLFTGQEAVPYTRSVKN